MNPIADVPPPTTNQGPSLTLSIGTGLYSPPLPGSLVTVVPGAIAEQTNTTAFVPVTVRFLEPVGPLASGTTYYFNMECNATTDGDPLILAGSAVDAYTKGTFNRDGNDLGRDLRFEIWGN